VRELVPDEESIFYDEDDLYLNSFGMGFVPEVQPIVLESSADNMSR
jgi:hypothetical protein